MLPQPAGSIAEIHEQLSKLAEAICSLGHDIVQERRFAMDVWMPQVHWRKRNDALPTLPSWASKGKTWAPEARPGPAGGGTRLTFTEPASYRWRHCACWRHHGCAACACSQEFHGGSRSITLQLVQMRPEDV